MGDRNLPEPDRGLDQWMRRKDQQIAGFNRTVTKTGRSKAAETIRTFYDGGTIGDDGFWVEHPVLEFDVDPGSWVFDGELAFELHWDGSDVSAIGRQDAHAIIDWREIGSASPASGDRIEFRECPMAYPFEFGSPQSTDWRTTIPVSKIVVTTVALTVRLLGLFQIANETSATAGGADFYLGPGILTATPL